MYVKVNGTNFIRDTKSMGLNNMDTAGKNEYLAKVKLLNKQKEELASMKSEINGIKGDLGEIKDLLKQLMENNNSQGN